MQAWNQTNQDRPFGKGSPSELLIHVSMITFTAVGRRPSHLCGIWDPHDETGMTVIVYRGGKGSAPCTALSASARQIATGSPVEWWVRQSVWLSLMEARDVEMPDSPVSNRVEDGDAICRASEAGHASYQGER